MGLRLWNYTVEPWLRYPLFDADGWCRTGKEMSREWQELAVELLCGVSETAARPFNNIVEHVTIVGLSGSTEARMGVLFRVVLSEKLPLVGKKVVEIVVWGKTEIEDESLPARASLVTTGGKTKDVTEKPEQEVVAAMLSCLYSGIEAELATLRTEEAHVRDMIAPTLGRFVS